MPDTIYVMELKVGDTARHALDQINNRGYAKPYLTDGRRVVKVRARQRCHDRASVTLYHFIF